MRTYKTQHAYYCGVDLHARSLYAHVLDDKGTTRLEQDLPANPATFPDAVRPYRDGLVVGCECLFAWYRLADLCERESIPFVFGHALAMKAIHGGKIKNDRLDAATPAGLLKGGFFPMAYVYTKAKRDLLRRRTFFVRQRAQLIAHIQNTNRQLNLPPFPKKFSASKVALRPPRVAPLPRPDRTALPITGRARRSNPDADARRRRIRIFVCKAA